MVHKERERSIEKASLSFFVLPSLAIILITVLVWSNSLDASWHLDDTPGILANQALKDADWAGLWGAQKNRFLTYASLSLNYQISGVETGSYHWVNLLIHSLNGVIVFALAALLQLKEEMPKRRFFWAFGAGLLFTLHPLTTSSVTYIVQRAELLCAFFLLSALLAYSLGRLSEAKTKARVYFSLSLLFGILALFSKEVGAIAAPLILLWDFFFWTKAESRKEKWRAFIKEKTLHPWFFLLLLTGLGLLLSGRGAQLFQSISWRGSESLTYSDYQWTQVKVFLRYLQLSILPLGQNIDHDIQVLRSSFSLAFLASASALSLLFYGAYLRLKTEPLALFFLLSSLLILAPSSSVFVLPDLMFEHRFYLPLAFLALYTSSELKRFSWGPFFLLCLIVSLSVLTIQRNEIWKTELRLWTDALKKSPNKERSLINGANALLEASIWRLETKEGSVLAYAPKEKAPSSWRAYPSEGLIPASEVKRSVHPYAHGRELYLRALKRNPQSRKARGLLALNSLREGQALQEQALEPDLSAEKRAKKARLCFLNAEFHFKRALRDNPKDAVATHNLGQLYRSYLGRPKEAESCFREVLRLTKSLPSAWFFLGTILLKQSKLKEAIECFQKYLELSKDDTGPNKIKDSCEQALTRAREALKKRS